MPYYVFQDIETNEVVGLFDSKHEGIVYINESHPESGTFALYSIELDADSGEITAQHHFISTAS